MRTQRWNQGRDSYRPAGEPINPAEYFVEPLEEARARAFVVRHHYSRSYPAARCRVGLFRRRPFFEPELVGVAVFSVPMSQRVVPRALNLEPAAGVELGRFVLLDEVPANGETWFLARAFRVLQAEKPEVRGVVSFADPVARVDEDGRQIMPGHVGTIYQAFNGRYLGRGTARTLYVSQRGLVVPPRALSKIRSGSQGREYSEQLLMNLGAPQPGLTEDRKAWVKRSLAGPNFRRFRHPGNHLYAWPLAGRPFEGTITPCAYPKAASC